MTNTLFHKKLGQGPPLIILHGLFGSLDNWMSIAKDLSIHWTVYLVDLRNHGQSFHHSQFNYRVMANDVQDLVQSLQLQGYALLGHSMGGKVAMFHALEHQEQVAALLIIDIAPKSYPVHHQTILDGLTSINPSQLESRQQADEVLKEHVPEPAVRQFLLKNLKRNHQGTFDWKMNLDVIEANIENIGEALPGHPVLTLPTLFLRGSQSGYISEGDFEMIQNQFPKAIINTVPNTGHWIHAEAPEAFLKNVKDFLMRS